jgi:hypothetical protein
MSRNALVVWCMAHGGWEHRRPVNCSFLALQQSGSSRRGGSIACALLSVSRHGHGPRSPALASDVPSRASIQARFNSIFNILCADSLPRVRSGRCCGCFFAADDPIYSPRSPTGRVARHIAHLRPLSALAMTSLSSAIQRSFNAPGHSTLGLSLRLRKRASRDLPLASWRGNAENHPHANRLWPWSGPPLGL